MLNMGQSYFSLTDGVGKGEHSPQGKCGAVPRVLGQEHPLREILLGWTFFPSTRSVNTVSLDESRQP